MSTTVKVWNGWDFENIAKGPRGEMGATGESGARGATGSTGPNGEEGLAGPAGKSGIAGLSAKGPVAPLSRFVQDGADGTTKYLYAMSNIIEYTSSGGMSYKKRIEGENDDAYGLGLVAIEVSGSEGAWTVKGLFVQARYDYWGHLVNKTEVNFTKQVSTLYDTELWAGYIDLDTYIYTRLKMQDGYIEFIGNSLQGRIFKCDLLATSSPSGNYVYRQADNAPTKDDTLSLVTSGGVAAAYCALIDKLAQYKGLSAAQVAMMKALYGA